MRFFFLLRCLSDIVAIVSYFRESIPLVAIIVAEQIIRNKEKITEVSWFFFSF